MVVFKNKLILFGGFHDDGTGDAKYCSTCSCIHTVSSSAHLCCCTHVLTWLITAILHLPAVLHFASCTSVICRVYLLHRALVALLFAVVQATKQMLLMQVLQ